MDILLDGTTSSVIEAIYINSSNRFTLARYVWPTKSPLDFISVELTPELKKSLRAMTREWDLEDEGTAHDIDAREQGASTGTDSSNEAAPNTEHPAYTG